MIHAAWVAIYFVGVRYFQHFLAPADFANLTIPSHSWCIRLPLILNVTALGCWKVRILVVLLLKSIVTIDVIVIAIVILLIIITISDTAVELANAVSITIVKKVITIVM